MDRFFVNMCYFDLGLADAEGKRSGEQAVAVNKRIVEGGKL